MARGAGRLHRRRPAARRPAAGARAPSDDPHGSRRGWLAPARRRPEYFTLRRVGDELPAIYQRPAPAPAARGTAPPATPIDPAGAYEVVVDPRPLSPDQTTRVELVAVEAKGRYLVYAVRDGGQDEHALRVRDLAASVDLLDYFPAALYSSVVPTAAGDGFYYSLRSRQTGARIRKHLWNTDPAADAARLRRRLRADGVRVGAAERRRPLARLHRAARLGLDRRVRARHAGRGGHAGRDCAGPRRPLLSALRGRRAVDAHRPRGAAQPRGGRRTSRRPAAHRLAHGHRRAARGARGRDGHRRRHLRAVPARGRQPRSCAST